MVETPIAIPTKTSPPNFTARSLSIKDTCVDKFQVRKNARVQIKKINRNKMRLLGMTMPCKNDSKENQSADNAKHGRRWYLIWITDQSANYIGYQQKNCA